FKSVVLGQRENVFLIEIGGNGFIFGQAPMVSSVALQFEPGKKAGSKRQIFIGKRCANADGTSGRTYLVINKVQMAAVWPAFFVRQPQSYFTIQAMRGAPMFLRRSASVFQEGVLICVKVSINRSQRNHRRKRLKLRWAAAYQIAGGNFRAAYAAGD